MTKQLKAVLRDETGFAIVVVTMIMVVTMVMFSAVVLRANQTLRLARQTEYNTRAELLARSGLERAIVETRANPTSYAGTPLTWQNNDPGAGRAYLVGTPIRQGDNVELVSTGMANGVGRQLRAMAAIMSGPSGVFDKAIYAGNVPPNGAAPNPNYRLSFGGAGTEGDEINGDVYSGNDVVVVDDAAVLPAVAESYQDLNGNNMYDRGDVLTLDIDGDGQYDPTVSEALHEDNGNGIYEPDLGETFDDANGNGQYDPRETFRDYNQNGLCDAGEPFTDSNGNNRYDYGIEGVGDVTYPGHPEAQGGSEPLAPPDLSAMNFPATADVNVSQRFGSMSSGTLPSSNPAHIFRKNSSSTFSEVDQVFTVDGHQINPDDYFLEDPYESVSTGEKESDSNATRISVSSASQGHEEGNNKVYFIDGNLWLHNSHTYSFKLKYPTSDGVRLTFVVRGNIVLSDNFYYNSMVNDQVSFIAMKREDDPNAEISGNVYIGDPRFGTIRYLHGLLYAENNFYDNNLDEEGSYQFDIYGNMTAGNQVAINRDYEVPGHYEWRFVSGRWRRVWVEPQTKHSKMVIDFDNRYIDGPNGLERMCPGLPNGPNRSTVLALRIASIVDVGPVNPPAEYWERYEGYRR
jgi:hypothetical protein